MSKHQLIAGALLGALLLSCGPTLKQSEEFTPVRVRELLFADTCKLQVYFDRGPGAYEQQSNFNIGTAGHRTAGSVVYRLQPGIQAEVFADLVAKLYDRVPPLPRSQPLDVTVEYQRSKGHHTLPIGAQTIVHLEPKEITLPYHPCLGAYFFGEPHYAARRAITDQDRWNTAPPPTP